MTEPHRSTRWTWTEVARSPVLWIILLSVVALAARLYTLSVPALRWDEGWSLAQASLPLRDLWRTATEEWHPPLYALLLKAWLTLGKSAGAGIQVKGLFVAPFQAQIVLENGSYYLMNIGHRRKTFLNGNKVVNRIKLRLEDRIQVGKSLFRFTTG